MSRASQANELEYPELARTLERFAECAGTADAKVLVALWPELEARVLARLDADKHVNSSAAASPASSLPPSEDQHLRNLAWEIGVSVDLHAVHLSAIRTLARLLRERQQRFAKPVASRPSIAHAAR